MTGFKGFSDGGFTTLALPAEFLEQVLPSIADVNDLKILIPVFQKLPRAANTVKFFFLEDLLDDKTLPESFTAEVDAASELKRILGEACAAGIFLSGEFESRTIFFLNTPLAKGALLAMQKGTWSPFDPKNAPPAGAAERPNIFRLYEENIGPLTPILAETLEAAEKEFPAEWIEEAIKVSVKKNIRNWNYVDAILRSWKEKGRNEKDQRNHQKNARQYIEGDLADYIKH